MNLDVSANLKNADSRTMARIQQYAGSRCRVEDIEVL